MGIAVLIGNPRVGPVKRMCSTVAAAGRKRRPRQVAAYGLPLVSRPTRRHLLFSTWLCLLSPLPFLRYSLLLLLLSNTSFSSFPCGVWARIDPPYCACNYGSFSDPLICR
ncbi:hypothetical protein PoB_003962500 [Plakobranchus ocellatus]|uniref:Uncharacterized protein n=1 Tax=Plakobranchus ocellatus TaxID=259542 RepID=A0AAV4AXM7_9GAST|nr:hypothetical protein PoB_003962500 [Plakobranchus ocellatus]